MVLRKIQKEFNQMFKDKAYKIEEFEGGVYK